MFCLEVINNIVFVEAATAGFAWQNISLVCVEMLFLVPDLVEVLITPCHRTFERSFTCMNSQMIEKIVPFFKQSFALKIIFLTGENTSCSVCVLISKLDL